jgi:hypothetical protein
VSHHRIASFLAVVLACPALPLSAGETGGEYTYTNLSVPDGLCGVYEVGTESQFPAAIKTVIDTRPDSGRRAPFGSYSACHTRQSLLPCESAQYHCFRTRGTHFAVPKQPGLHVGQRWVTMETTFKVVRVENIAYLGTHHATFVIARENMQSGTTYFYWSEDAGLVAIRNVMTVRGDESVEANVLEGARGFPF